MSALMVVKSETQLREVLAGKSVKELKALVNSFGVSGYSRLNRANLVEVILAGYRDQEALSAILGDDEPEPAPDKEGADDCLVEKSVPPILPRPVMVFWGNVRRKKARNMISEDGFIAFSLFLGPPQYPNTGKRPNTAPDDLVGVYSLNDEEGATILCRGDFDVLGRRVPSGIITPFSE